MKIDEQHPLLDASDCALTAIPREYTDIPIKYKTHSISMCCYVTNFGETLNDSCEYLIIYIVL